ncbi:MAG TPA: flagellar export protein FliJ [Bdellovibrionales bacterium]|nr:flagellar export protein FliJ [Bdellovibrionales bacterium]
MKFKFRLERVMSHKRTERDLAFRDFAEAQRNYEAGREKLDKMYEEISEAKRFESQLVVSGGAPAETLKWSAFFLEGQKVRIENQKSLNRQLIQEMERKQEILIERARELKTFEKLKERQAERFKLSQKKHDMKTIDEIVVTSAAQKIKAS